MAVILAVALVVGTGDDGGAPTNAERTYALARQVKCPQCAGQSVAESDVVISREIRRDIAKRVEAGQTDQEILDAYAARYGEAILLEPSTSGSTGVVWLLPVVALLAGLATVVVVFRRWQATTRAEASDDDRALVADALAHDASVSRPGSGADGDDP
jgi:cytochrome c-type biogenesis protein CcmH/NrfF